MDVVRFVTTVLIKADNGRIFCILLEQFWGATGVLRLLTGMPVSSSNSVRTV